MIVTCAILVGSRDTSSDEETKVPTFEFTSHLSMHLDCPTVSVSGRTLSAALDQVFERNPKLRGYVLDDQGGIRKHVAVFVDNQLLRDRTDLQIPLDDDSRIFVMQALSGG